MEAKLITHSVDLGEMDGAIVFRPSGVEVLLPNIPNDSVDLPEHIYLAIALITKLKDEEFIRDQLAILHKKVDDYRESQKGK